VPFVLDFLYSTMNNRVGQRRRRDNTDLTGQMLPRRVRTRTWNHACDLCTLMFSREGLQYLNSLNGLRHRTRNDCVAAGDEGCKICKFIFLAISKEHDGNWAGSDLLIFRNFRHTSSKNIHNIQPGIYGLQGTFESKPNVCVITIHSFAERGRHSLSYQ
jgi:hypothetical protein